MESINSILETQKIYFSPFTIPIGNYNVSHKSLSAAIKSLSAEYKINCKIYSMAYKFNEPVTFTDCFNKQYGYYYCLPRPVYRLRKSCGVKGIVNNANILAYLNNDPMVDVYKMRFWFLFVAYTYKYSNPNVTINELLISCCNMWKKLYEDGTMFNCMLKQSIKNIGRKTFTIGNISANEKRKLSEPKKFNEEEQHYIKCWRVVDGYSYRRIVAEYKATFGRSISYKTVYDICNQNEQCLEQRVSTGNQLLANLQDTVDIEQNNTSNEVESKQCLEQRVSTGNQLLDVVETTFDTEDEWSDLENAISSIITKDTNIA